MELAENFSLLAVGIDSLERLLLNGIVTLSTARDRHRHYHWFDPAAHHQPDLVVVAAHNDKALAEIRDTYCDTQGKPRLPIVVLGAAGASNDPYHHIGGPLVTTRVLNELDRTTAGLCR